MNCPHCGKAITLSLVPVGAAAGAPPPSAAAADLGNCPTHHRPWEYKSGVSKNTGKAYAFWACSVRDEAGYCQQKPARAWNPPPPPSAAPKPELDELEF